MSNQTINVIKLDDLRLIANDMRLRGWPEAADFLDQLVDLAPNHLLPLGQVCR